MAEAALEAPDGQSPAPAQGSANAASGAATPAPRGASARAGAPKAAAEGRSARRSWRPLLRALHRDAGYLAVGLTVIYALSGLAVNHIADWDPNFQSYERRVELGRLEGDDDAIAAQALAKLGISDPPQEVYRAAADRLEIVLNQRSVHVDTATGSVVDEGQKPRFFLRAANWLHLNRGKQAWRYIADAYAAGLLLLAAAPQPRQAGLALHRRRLRRWAFAPGGVGHFHDPRKKRPAGPGRPARAARRRRARALRRPLGRPGRLVREAGAQTVGGR
ncbi:MAG: hypothetical protein MUF34_20320 [Polyangiaceae bacterium]|nr:hypothetical protein [Polyangiaceae bacterium]